MTNFEYYKDEIKKIADDSNTIAVRDGEIVACATVRCNDCKFKSTNDSFTGTCGSRMLLWLYEEHKEHKETPKLTAREYNILKAIGRGYLTKDQDGKICANVSKPKKYGVVWINSKNRVTTMFWPKELFNFIKWEDNEQYSIEEMLTWEHEEED